MPYTFKFNDPRGGYSAWEFKHITSISTGVTKDVKKYGIPNKSANASQFFEMTGAMRTFTISFVRYDYEEDISNWDFAYTLNNMHNGKCYKGLEWCLSQLQVMRPYLFAIQFVSNNDEPTDPGTILTGVFNVAVTSFKFEQNPTNLAEGIFTLSLTERRA